MAPNLPSLSPDQPAPAPASCGDAVASAAWTCRARGGRRWPTTTCAATSLELDLDDADVGPSRRCPATGARTPLRRAPTARCCTAAASSCDRPEPRAGAAGSSSTASSTRATSGSTAPTSATPRATSSRTPSRSPRLCRARPRARARPSRSTCAPPTRPHGEAQHHRRLPALGLPRPGLEPRRHLAAGARSTTRARCASTGSACCAARPTTQRAVLALRAELDAADATTVDAAHAVGDGTERRATSTRWPPASNQVDVDARHRATRAVVAPRARRPAALRRRRRGRSPVDGDGRATRRASVRTGLRAGARCSELDAVTSTASGCSSRAPTRARRGMALGEATPDELARATSRWPRRPASTCCASTATSPGPSCTTPPTRLGMLLWQDLPAAVGVRPQRSASRRCARRARRSTCSATTRRSPCGAATTSRSPSTSSRAAAIGGSAAVLRRSARSCRRGTRPCSTAR